MDYQDTRGFRRDKNRGNPNNQKQKLNRSFGSEPHKRKLNSTQLEKIAILEDTLASFKQQTIPSTEKWSWDDFDDSLFDNPKPGTNLKVVFDKKGTIDCALKITEKATILNFASYKCPGGGVRIGSNAQEEDICRCTNLLPSLERIPYYPLQIDELLFTKDVSITKDENYNYIDIKNINVISCAAVRVDTFNANRAENRMEEIAEILKHKIECIFRLAIFKKVQILVLGPFGCGAYGNDSIVVAKLFSRAIIKYGNHFKAVYFSFKYDGNNMRSIYNYDTFERVFREDGMLVENNN